MPVSSKIPLLDLNRQVQGIRQELDEALQSVLEATAFVNGPSVREFESGFSAYCETSHCVGVGNGTDALEMIFRALNLQHGDEVITTPMSFIATIEPLVMLGVKPVFADIEPDTYNLDPQQVAPKITSKTKALLPVHLYGQPATMEPLLKLTAEKKLYLVEDCAQAHGAKYQNKRIGSFGHASAFSFYPGKNLGAYGDAGAVTTNDAALAEKVRMLANHGRKTKYEHDIVGTNSRLDTLHAAVLSVKLRHLDSWNAGRVCVAEAYRERLGDMTELVLPHTAVERTHVYHQFVIRVQEAAKRDTLLQHLNGNGVGAGVHYPIPLHLQPACKFLGYKTGDFPHAEALGASCISLPMFPELTEAEIDYVASTLRAFFGK